MAEGIVPCPSCDQKNRIPPDRFAAEVKCGACGTPLGSLADAIESMRVLILASMAGMCPFCMKEIGAGHRSALMTAIGDRRMHGPGLKDHIATLRAKQTEAGIDDDTGHALDCRGVAMIKAPAD